MFILQFNSIKSRIAPSDAVAVGRFQRVERLYEIGRIQSVCGRALCRKSVSESVTRHESNKRSFLTRDAITKVWTESVLVVFAGAVEFVFRCPKTG